MKVNKGEYVTLRDRTYELVDFDNDSVTLKGIGHDEDTLMILSKKDFALAKVVVMPTTNYSQFKVGDRVSIVDKTSELYHNIGVVESITFYANNLIAYHLRAEHNSDVIGDFAEWQLEKETEYAELNEEDVYEKDKS